jgi:RND family efflux transporter MFP subunit
MRVNNTIYLGLFAFTIIAMTSFTTIAPAHAQGLSQDQRRAIIQGLSDDERQKFFGMSQEEKQKFFQAKAKGGKPGEKAGGKSGSKVSAGGPSGGKGGKRRGRPPTLVELGEVVRQPLLQTFPITGRLIASQKGPIAARIKGSVRKILVEVGDRVKVGQALAELDVDRLKLEAELRSADVLQARAKWKSSQAQVDLLNQELKRLQRLRKSAAFSQARFDDKKQEVVKAKSAVDESAASLKRARAQRDLARIDLKDATIRAPYPGAILVRHVSPGAYIAAGSPIVTLIDDESMEIEADVPSIRLSGIPEGRVIDVQLDNKTIIKAAVRAIIPDENPLARTRAVRLDPDLSGTKIKLVANQSVVLLVPQGESRRVIAIPKDAVVNRQSGKIVYVFEKGKVRSAPVEIGESFGGKFEILSGVKPGQKVVIKGNELLRPGQRVRVNRTGGKKSVRKNGAKAGAKNGGGSDSSIPREKRRALIQSLSAEERQKFFSMSQEEKQKFFRDKIGGAS